eukprot:3333483-Pleurochrysis_carterae.AAC.1
MAAVHVCAPFLATESEQSRAALATDPLDLTSHPVDVPAAAIQRAAFSTATIVQRRSKECSIAALMKDHEEPDHLRSGVSAKRYTTKANSTTTPIVFRGKAAAL